MPDTITAPAGADNSALVGSVYGGQQPITAAHVYVFEADNGTGYGTTAPTSLLGNIPSPSGAGCDASVTLPLVYDNIAHNCYYQTGGANFANPTAVNPLDTDPGGFNLTGFYACTPGANVWLYSISGYPTSNGGVNALNPYAGLMAALGQCPSTGAANFSKDHFIYMNELSTVAMAYAVAGFAGDTTNFYGTNLRISTSATNVVGFNNAFNNAFQLYNFLGTGTLPPGSTSQSTPATTPAGVGTLPYVLMNTLGDILAACINSPSQNTGSPQGACAILFDSTYTDSSLGHDTASAAINIAQHAGSIPPRSLTPLLNLSTAAAPFLPNNKTTTGVYNDLSVAISYKSAAIASPKGVALDGAGNAFVSAYSTTGNVVQLSPLGVVTTTTNGTKNLYDDVASLTVDSAGFIWAPGMNSGDLLRSNPANNLNTIRQEAMGTFTTDPGGIPDAIAADNSAFVYIADPIKSGGEIYKVKNSALANPLIITASTVPGAHGCVTGANGVAVDSTGALWVTGTGSPNVVCRISNTGTTYYTGAGSTTSPKISEADGVAVDNNNTAWIFDNNNSIVRSITTGGVVSQSVNGGGINAPTAIAIDGSNNVFVLNDQTSTSAPYYSISEYSNTGVALSGNSGFQSTTLTTPTGLGIDISGNVWVSNFGASSVVEVIGIASPTVGPLSTQRPGLKP